jgi:hypothetical protein
VLGMLLNRRAMGEGNVVVQKGIVERMPGNKKGGCIARNEEVRSRVAFCFSVGSPCVMGGD